MTAARQFIEDALVGGWFKSVWTRWTLSNVGVPHPADVPLDCIFLDPLAWQAVGKTRGWGEYENANVGEADAGFCWECGEKTVMPEWRFKMIVFTENLADGKTIEEALTALAS